jgi:hypothetical protein
MRKDDIVIRDIPTEEFKKITSGSQFSLQVTLPTPPYKHQRIIIYSAEKPLSNQRPQIFITHLTTFISFDTVIASSNFYDIRWRPR